MHLNKDAHAGAFFRPAASPTMSVAHLATLLCLVCASNAAPPDFSNSTADAGLTHTHLTFGFNSYNYSGGSTVGDFNNDGFVDIFVVSGGNNNQRDRLFINNTDGTFSNRAAEWGLSAVHRGKSAIAADFNHDGWIDLYVTSAGPVGSPSPGHHKLYRNDSNAETELYRFTNIANQAGVNASNPSAEDAWTACFGDYDLDGDLDLYVGGFAFGAPNNNGNRLFQSNVSGGGETFTDVTAAIGLFSGVGPIANLSSSFADMNADGWPELLLVGDFKGITYVGSRYFRNNGPDEKGIVTFTDYTIQSNTGHEENGMGHTVGDFQNDGRLDWYVTSIYNGGSWTGNKLYRNTGFHAFAEHAQAAGVHAGFYGWGATAADFNNDGWCDLAATNGDSSSSGTYGNKPSQLWINNANPPNTTFTELASAADLNHFGKGRTLVSLDYNRDGAMDLLLTANNEPLFFFENELDLSAGDADWIRIALDTSEGASDGSPLAPHGIGAKITITIDNKRQMRWITGGISFLGGNELVAHFGLGTLADDIVDEVRVKWPVGDDTVVLNVPANQTITLTPPSSQQPPCPGDLSPPGGDQSVGVPDLLALLACWGEVDAGSACAAADLTDDENVGVPDLLELLAAWGECE